MVCENNFLLDETSKFLYAKNVNFPGTLKPTSFIEMDGNGDFQPFPVERFASSSNWNNHL